MNDYVFQPIGMQHTVADQVHRIIENRTRYYGFLSSSEDLVRFGSAHLDDKFLKPETTQLLWASQKTEDGKEINYGIGYRIYADPNGRRSIGHGGGSVGGRTVFRM